MMVKYKLREVASDLGVANKDVIDVLSKYFGGEPKKQTAVLTEEELNIVFDYFTQKNNMESFDAYYAANGSADKSTEDKAGENSDKKSDGKRKPQSKDDKQGKKQDGKNTAAKQNVKKQDSKPQAQSDDNKNDNGNVQFKNRKERKIVDTRQVVVDVERYNEKYDRLASEKIKSENQTAHKQKINQRSQQRNKQRRGKRETEQERLNRIAMERKRSLLLFLFLRKFRLASWL